MQFSNYHSHTNFCDGRSYPENFIQFAIANHFRAYGFSSHSPLPFETFWNMSKDDVDEYIEEITRLRKKYFRQIYIYIGMEIDYLNDAYNPSIPYFQQLPLDYRIGSVHFLPQKEELQEKNMVCIDGSYTEFQNAIEKYYEGNVQLIVAHYFDSVYKMIEKGGIDIVGHLDKIYMNAQHCPGFNQNASWYQQPFQKCLELAAEKQLIVEINSKNYRSKGEIYPHQQYLHLLNELQIPVMVNSDCHYPDLVNDGRIETIELLKQAGFKSIRELIGDKWVDTPI